MIDEQKIIGLLQAKALGCLDTADEILLHDFIDGGHVFPWSDLGAFQSIASLLPLSLALEIPDPSLKDKVALRLIKLTEEIRAQKALEEEPQTQPDEETFLPQEPEIIEAEFEQTVEEFEDFTEPISEPQIEVKDTPDIQTEIPDITEETNFNMEVEEATFNLDDVVLPDYESISVSQPEFDQIGQSAVENMTETPLEEPVIESPPLESIESAEETIIETLPNETVESVEESLEESLSIETPAQPDEPLLNVDEVVELSEQIQENITEQVQETTQEVFSTPNEPIETEKLPDLTKRSVADKMFKAIEQDFDSLKYHYEESERKLTRGLLISYVVIAVLFALLIFSFFKFSADIKGLEEEIRSLKKNPTSSLIDTKNISSTHHYFC
jgi:hypothetical protein